MRHTESWNEPITGTAVEATCRNPCDLAGNSVSDLVGGALIVLGNIVEDADEIGLGGFGEADGTLGLHRADFARLMMFRLNSSAEVYSV